MRESLPKLRGKDEAGFGNDALDPLRGVLRQIGL